MKGMEASLVLIVAVLACAVSQPLLNTTGKGCNENRDCTSDQICTNLTCVDPCEGMCGVNAACVVEDNPPMCSCKAGFNGDPFLECEPEVDAECTENSECPADKACVSQQCVDPCQDPDVCGLNTECRVKNHRPICACLRMFKLIRGQGCKPISVPECQTNSNCPKDLSCRQQKCVDPCQEDVCGNNTICSVKNHFPICACKVGYIGDALHECVPSCSAKENVKSNETSYVISDSKMKWFDALNYCASKGMRLAMVKDEKEWDDLLVTWNSKQYGSVEMWLGGHDFGEYQHFRWTTTGELLTFEKWDTNEPTGQEYHCLKVKNNMEWMSQDCYQLYYFACEIR